MEINNENIDWLFNKAAADILKKHREEANLSLEDVVKKMKTPISRQSLFKYENNLARIKNNTFIDICNVLKIEPDEVFADISASAMQYKYCLDNDIDLFKIDKNGKMKQISFYHSADNSVFDETNVLFDKYKDLLTEDDKETIRFIIEKRKRKIDKELGKD
ncbi:MAG: helix-turn-helix transcriptional regulator [bacterium]|nr:helix-turn-helix transcriptional regulator [bacterium]